MPLPENIFDACRQGNIEMVKQIEDQYPGSVNMEDSKGFTSLILAVYYNQLSVVEFLLSKGAHVNACDAAGNTALMGVCFKGYNDIALQLIAAGADVNQQNSQGATALIFAVTFGQMEIAEILLKNNADITIADMRGKTPLDHARMQENWPMYDLLGKYANNGGNTQ